MVTTVLVVLMILALLEIVLLNCARLFMIASAVQQAQDDKYTPHQHPQK